LVLENKTRYYAASVSICQLQLSRQVSAQHLGSGNVEDNFSAVRKRP